MRRPSIWSAFLVLLVYVPLVAAGSQPGSSLDRKFQAAVAQYESGRFAEAAAQLEALLHEVPQSFEVHELLGLVYAAQSQDAQARKHLEVAVRLKPDSAAARPFLEQAQRIDPSSYDNGYDLALAYVLTGRLTDARQWVQDLLKTKNT